MTLIVFLVLFFPLGQNRRCGIILIGQEKGWPEDIQTRLQEKNDDNGSRSFFR